MIWQKFGATLDNPSAFHLKFTSREAPIAFAKLAEKGSDIDVLRLMDMDVEGRCGAGYDEKRPERINSRNSYRECTWDTRAGSVWA